MRHEVITTCTRDCPNACGLIARVDEGRVTSLRGNPQHPLTKGFSCQKCPGFVARTYSSERVLTPLKRTGSSWRRIGWDQALDEIAGRMAEIRERAGAQAILYYRGFAQRTALKLLNDRFFNLFGGVTGTRGTLCGGTGQAGQDLDFGRRVSHDPLDHENSRSLIIWGRNPAVTNPYLLPIMDKVRLRGGKVVVIDPVATETSRLGDMHIAPAPGTDAFLALAAIKIILSRGEEERSFITSNSEGFEALLATINDHPLDRLALACDVPLPQIEMIADLMSRHKPTAILLGWGLHRWLLGHQTVRLIDALAAVSGTIGMKGGGVSQGFDEYAPYDLSLTLDHLHPGRRRLLMPRIGAEILDARAPKIEMIFVTAGNPVCQAPNAARVAKAFDTTPFVVVSGHFLDDTGSRADLFLPTTTFLEEEDVVASYGHNYLGPVHRAIQPLGESRSDFDIFGALASRLELGSDFERPADEWLRLLLAPVLGEEMTWQGLQEGAVRLSEAPMVPYADRIFPTPTGKFRFLTRFEPPATRRCADFPYQLLSVSPSKWLGSELSPAELRGLTEVRISPATARREGLSEGDLVRVVSEVGKTAATVRINTFERGDTIVFPRGRWLSSGSSANLLTLDLVSREGDGAPYYETAVRLEKME